MPTPQNENLGQMIDNVNQDYPLYERSIIKRRINDHLRSLIARRPWSGLVKYAHLSIPAVYTTGLVDVTLASATISGTTTAWPTNDVVNTALPAAITDTNYQEVAPTLMTGIVPGVWLLIGQGTANVEAVFVIATTATTFTAKFTKTHAMAETVLRSSLAGRQFRTGVDSPFYTVTAVPTATSILLDKPWATASAVNQGYSICLVYTSLGQDVKQVWTMVNLARHYQLYLHAPTSYLDYIDPRRTTTESTFMLVFHEVDPSGSPLYELYPRPLSQQVFPYFYIKQWDNLSDDNDFLPNGIRSDVMVRRVKADAARWPQHKILKGGIYYDINASALYNREAEAETVQMILEDDSTNMMSLMWDYTKWPYKGFGSTFWQSHDSDAFYGDV